MKRYDAIFVGGGLASGIVGLRLKRTRPELNVLFVEAESQWGGNHTWSFHQTDISPQDQIWLRPLLSKEWSGHCVRFPKFTRGIAGSYFSIRAEDFHRVMMAELGASTRLNTRVMEIRNDGVVLASGEILYAKTVFDARGAFPAHSEASGYQKFIGWEVELEGPHGLRTPTLMDAQVEQKEGFRFIYLLPWDTHTLLVEDTRYSSDPDLYTETMRADFTEYCNKRGWKVKRVVREERGCLSIPLTEKELRQHPNTLDSSVFRLGVRAGHFQPTTGYSLPYAVRLANLLGNVRAWEATQVAETIVGFEQAQLRFQRFSLFLNRMLFRGAGEAERYKILERFYSLSQALIERFYSGESAWSDKARILLGRPPIPVRRALDCLLDESRRSQRTLSNRILTNLLPSEVRS